jgi:C1A family cysteine protease
MMKWLLIVLVVLILHHDRLAVVGMFDEELSELWTRFKITHRKQYTEDNEDNYRRSVFAKNVEYISLHNMQADLGQHTFTLGINEFADLTAEEFKFYMLGARAHDQMTMFDVTNHTFDDKFDDVTADAVDWRTRGFVTRVKQQGQCGSCWAFSTTGALEGQWFKKTGRLVALSEQNLVDCDKAQHGCNGGWPPKAFEYITRNNGIDTEQSYPYNGKDTNPCRFQPSTVGARCSGYRMVTPQTERVLQQAVATVGPISVAIDAGQQSFMFYKSGVYVDPRCTQNINHAVLTVGYGQLQGQDYWIIKNSWGTEWGMQGYVLMARNRNNQCGIATYASYPVV